MKIKSICIIIGTRPQIIKSQPVINQLKKGKFELNIVNTGQHYDFELSKKFFTDLSITKPSINLGIGKGTPNEQISKILVKIENYFNKQQTDLVIVPGDTTSAVAAAIATSKCGIKLAHLESGARSNQFYMAEEKNRRIIDHCSNFLFAPTKNCLKNLKDESVFGQSFFVGDTMYDLFLEFEKKYNFKSLKMNSNDKQILLTIHRAENIQNKKNLRKICIIVNRLVKKGYQVIFPVHPHTRKNLKNFKLILRAEMINPLGYLDLMRILANSSLVITDSGGLQKEAYWMGKPCITLRESTEWVETIEDKSNFLFPLSKSFPFERVSKLSKLKISPKGTLFGSGNASKNIVKIISKLQL